MRIVRGGLVVQKLWHDLAWEQFLSWQESGDADLCRR